MGTVKMDELSASEYHDKLLGAVKAQVKAIMEESVTKKFVHEESEHVLRLCATIQTCLLDHLRKRTAGFLRTNKIANLFNKVGKSIPEVAQLVIKIEEAESAIENQLPNSGKTVNGMRPQTLQLRQLKQIWVRMALTEKKMDKIVEFLADNSSKFYEKDAIIADPVYGRILSSLLVGPCALEYTKMKTSDHYWSDPPADELLQRHKLHCRNEASSPGRRPTLHSTSKYTPDPTDKGSNGNGSGSTFREYVESLHQNSKSTLLYGKNNVVVQPREEVNAIHGYLSLHQVLDSLYIKWTPNQLMNVNEQKKSVNCNHDKTAGDGNNQENEGSRPALVPNGVLKNSKPSPKHHSSSFFRREYSTDTPKTLSSYWEYAISVNVQDVVYLHCHQRNDAGGTLVLVGQDGVQRSPICFPPGGHLLAFLTCLETGLLPHGHLDPPLWSQHGKGKVFPKLRKRSSHSSSSGQSVGSQSEAEEATDFVFRVTTGKSNMIYLTGSPESSPPAESPSPPPYMPKPPFGEQILAMLACDPNATTTYPYPIPQSQHSRALALQSTFTPLLASHIPRTIVMRSDVAPNPISYDKKLYHESTIAPPSTFPHLHFMFLPHRSGGSAGTNIRRSSATPVNKEPSQAREPVVEVDQIHENFDAYAIGPGYSCYDAQDSKQTYSSRSSLKVLCDTMRRQIISRAFYGWLAHCRHLSTVRTHLSALVLPSPCQPPVETVPPIDKQAWESFLEDGKVKDSEKLMERVYFGGIEHSMRSIMWPFLLNHYPMESTPENRENIDAECVIDYEKVVKEWRIVEKIIKRKERENLVAKMSSDSRTSSTSSLDGPPKQYAYISALRKQSTMSDVFASLDHDSSTLPAANTTLETVSDVNENEKKLVENGKQNGGMEHNVAKKRRPRIEKFQSNFITGESKHPNDHTPYSSISTEPSANDRRCSNLTITSTSIETANMSVEDDSRLNHILESDEPVITSHEKHSSGSDSDSKSSNRKTPSLTKQNGIDMANSIDRGQTQDLQEEDETGAEDSEMSMAEDFAFANFTTEILDNFGLNLHRIEKDVHRCDRNHEYFTSAANLDKLRNIMCSYVWRHLDTGYMQGMCDLCAPLLLVLDDESMVYSCFTQLMERMGSNFPNGGAMDAHFANMRSLIQVLDAELFEHMHRNGDYTHFYFCYRWFLLDFKRELSYENDVFTVWESIWAARSVCSEHFVLFFALALLHNYRDIILDNEMDFTDIIKFFNEMAERHNAAKILKLAQNFVYEVQSMISK